MSFGFNRVTIIGYLGHNPELRYTQSNIAISNLRIAVSSKRKDGNEWKLHTDWFSVICFGKSAENVNKFLQKGKQVFVEGRLQNRSWEDKTGHKQNITEIIANQIIFLGNRNTNNIEDNKENTSINNIIPAKNDINEDVPF